MKVSRNAVLGDHVQCRLFLPMAFEVPAIHLTTVRQRTECSCAIQLTEQKEFGSPGRIRTYSLSVNSRNDRKSKCPIWCRLREIGSHFSFFSCTHTCTHASSSESGCTASVATMLTLLVVPFSLKLIRPAA